MWVEIWGKPTARPPGRPRARVSRSVLLTAEVKNAATGLSQYAVNARHLISCETTGEGMGE